MQRLILTFLTFTTLCLGAQTNLDSLYSVWTNNTKSDSVRAEAFKKYIWEGIIYSAPDSAFNLAEDLIAFGQNESYLLAVGEGYNIQGVTWMIRGNPAKSLDFFTKSLEARKKAGNKRAIASSLNSLGGVHSTHRDQLKAIKFFNESLDICRQLKDTSAIASSLGNLGVAYMRQGNPIKALDCFAQSLTYAEKARDRHTLAKSLEYMGAIHGNQKNFSKALEYLSQSLTIFNQMGHKSQIAGNLEGHGNIYNEQGNYTQALDYYSQSLELYEEIKDKVGVARALSSSGLAYLRQSHYPEALNYFTRSLEIAKGVNDKSIIASNLHNMGNIDLLQDHPQEAITKCKRSLKLAEEVDAMWSQIKSCECLYETYKALGKGNEALLYHEKMLALKDSLQMEESSKHLQQIEFAKQKLTDSLNMVEKERLVKEAHKQEVRKQNTIRNYLLGAGSLLFLLSAGFYSRWRYVRKSRDIIAQEKDRSNNLLLNILPQDIAEELKTHGRAEARDFQQVNILFTDFKDFTQTSAKLSAKELVAEINTCFEAFDDIMVKYGIEKIKTIGDAYMAAGGLPIPSEDSIKNTVLAALEIQEFIKTRSKEQNERGLPYFEMRVGIHTGPIVAGIVGVKKFQYDVWGDTVNTASRMESSGEVGKVNISHETYEMLKHDPNFNFSNRGKIEVKGKGEIEMWFVSLKTQQ